MKIGGEIERDKFAISKIHFYIQSGSYKLSTHSVLGIYVLHERKEKRRVGRIGEGEKGGKDRKRERIRSV